MGSEGEVKIWGEPICFPGQSDLQFPREYSLDLVWNKARSGENEVSRVDLCNQLEMA